MSENWVAVGTPGAPTANGDPRPLDIIVQPAVGVVYMRRPRNRPSTEVLRTVCRPLGSA
jgi:hypothetical protein